MKAIKLVLFLEVLVGIAWTLTVSSMGTEDLGVLLVFLLTAPVFLVLMGIGAWKAYKEPETRLLAAWVMLLPIGFLFLPATLSTILGSSAFSGASGRRAWMLLAGAPVAVTLFRPRAVGSYLPRFIVASRAFNLAVVAALLVVLGSMGLLAFSFFNQDSIGSAAMPIFAALIPVIVAGAGFAIVVCFTAYLGFFQPDGRKQNGLRVLQLILALPIPLIVAAGFLAVAALSYG